MHAVHAVSCLDVRVVYRVTRSDTVPCMTSFWRMLATVVCGRSACCVVDDAF